MALRKIITRTAAIGFGLAAGGVYAANSGLIPLPGLGSSGEPPMALAATMGTEAQGATAQAPVSERAPVPALLQARVAEQAPDATPIATPIAQAATVEMASLTEIVPDTLPDLSATIPEAAPGSDAMRPGDLAPVEETSALGLPCTLDLTASAAPAAMIALDLLAPCQPNMRVQVEHSGMTIAASTDALGLLTLDLPAFESPAFITVRMSDDKTESLLVSVPDLSQFDRVGLSWDGDRALELHAMEGGASFGAPGHVWAESAGALQDAIDGRGGYMVMLGDADVQSPLMAQVYTLPRSMLDDGSSVAMSIDAPVTEGNCSLRTDAVTLRSLGGGVVEITDLSFTNPGCDAVGDILVLQNLLGPLRLAAN